MTWLAPGYLVAAAAASAMVVALHLIMHRRPPPAMFPTARFVPAGSARAVRRALRPNDVALLLLRVGTLMLAGAALARPVPSPERRLTARIVVLDQSRAVAVPAAARDSALRLVGQGDRLIVFDSVARLTTTVSDSFAAAAPDSLAAAGRRARGNLAAGLVAAIQVAPDLRRVADSVEVVVVSPFVREEFDAATAAIRAQWPGRIRLVQVAGDTSNGEGREEPPAIEVRAEAGDALAVAASLATSTTGSRAVRLVRAAPTSADSSWARAGGVLVYWPADDAGSDRLSSTQPVADASDDSATDSIGAVMAGSAVVVAPFERSLRRGFGSEAGDRPVAWWADGEVAAVERAAGAGCIREVVVSIPAKGDLVLRTAFRRFLLTLLEPCGGAVDGAPAPEATLAALAGSGRLARASALPVRDEPSRLAPWLMAAALLLAMTEPFVRRPRRSE